MWQHKRRKREKKEKTKKETTQKNTLASKVNTRSKVRVQASEKLKRQGF